MRTLTVLLLVTAALAGCADGAPEAAPEGPQARDVEATDTTAAISGVVVDETIRPVAGARVVLVSTGDETTTDDVGTFVFEDLEPGVYAVEASAERFLTTQTTVDVQAGKVAKPRILLPADTSPVPYHQTTQFNGHMVVSDYYGVYILTATLGNNEACQCMFNITADPAPKTIVVEGTWESSTPRVEEHDMYWELWTESTAEDYPATWSVSPTLWHVPGGQFGQDDEFTVQVSSGEQPDVEQEFEGFVTFFYVQEAPSGWSLVAGDS